MSRFPWAVNFVPLWDLWVHGSARSGVLYAVSLTWMSAWSCWKRPELSSFCRTETHRADSSALYSHKDRNRSRASQRDKDATDHCKMFFTSKELHVRPIVRASLFI